MRIAETKQKQSDTSHTFSPNPAPSVLYIITIISNYFDLDQCQIQQKTISRNMLNFQKNDMQLEEIISYTCILNLDDFLVHQC